jgi:hypothetical protein
VDSPIFDRMTEKEMQAMFDRENGQLRIKSWIKEGINWQVADAGDPGLAEVWGGARHSSGKSISLPYGSDGCGKMSAQLSPSA